MSLTGLPVVIGATGLFVNSTAAVTANLNEALALKAAYILWYAKAKDARSVGLAEPDGTLNENGHAYAAFVAAHSGR